MTTPDPNFWWNWWVQLATALATFLAVLAALFLDWFRSKFFPPLLFLELVDKRGAPPTGAYIMTAGQPTAFQTVSRWYHVRVENRRRMTRATETQVCLVEVGIPNAAGKYVSQSVGAIPLKVRNEGVVRPGRIIGPPVEWDLCSIYRELAPGGRPVFELHTVVAPTNITVRTDQPHKVLLTLQARSIEADSNFLNVELVWDGQWADDTDQMTQHLVITAQ
jgi:hypothetical protein